MARRSDWGEARFRGSHLCLILLFPPIVRLVVQEVGRAEAAVFSSQEALAQAIAGLRKYIA